jgi:DNA mismatch endonuclease (patch repair protein)
MDMFSQEKRSEVMRRVRSRGTAPEMVVRRLVHAMGFRYRLHVDGLPGKPDLVFPARRKVILVHGCFWHGHSCKSGRKRPKSNVQYWKRKLRNNTKRDAANLVTLHEFGWNVFLVWECETKSSDLADRLREFLEEE